MDDMNVSENKEQISALDRLPQELLTRSQWVCWRWMGIGNDRSKVPYDPKTGRPASTTDPPTWASYATAVAKAEKSGWDIGFALSEEDDLVAVDLDNCRDPETGEIKPKAQEIIDRFASYTEVSPSGRGIHIWVRGQIPADKSRRRRGWETGANIEAYAAERYFTVTGERVANTPLHVVEAQDALDWLFATYLPSKSPADEPAPPSAWEGAEASDDEVLRKAMNARNSDKFLRLWNGDTSQHNNDHSAADFALCQLLAYWTNNNRAQMDRLFRRSKLYRDKWERDTYRDPTLDNAIAANRDVQAGIAARERGGKRS